MKTIFIWLAALLLFTGALPAATAAPNTITVDCDRGQTIANALMQGDFRKQLVVNIRGTCNGSVRIERENVTLSGDGTATIIATDASTDAVTVVANGANLEGLTLSGGRFGVSSYGVFRLVISDCVIEDTHMDGIRVFAGDTRVIRTTVQRAGANGVYVTRGGSVVASNSQFLNNSESGIYAYGNSTITANNSIFTGNVTGVLLGTGSQGSFNNNNISSNDVIGITVASSQARIGGDNTIENNGGTGIWVYHGGLATIFGNTIQGNAWDGVAGDIGTTLVMNQNAIRNNGGFGIACGNNCTMELDQHTGADYSLTGNGAGGIVIGRASQLTLIGEVTVDGDGWGLQCDDKESSVGDAYLFNGTVSPGCTGFDD